MLRPAFADLIGSTSFAESLDPEDARDLLGGAVERLVLAIEELGGPFRISRETAYSHFSERPWRTRTIPSEPYARACGSSKKSLPTAGGLSVRVGIESGRVVLGPPYATFFVRGSASRQSRLRGRQRRAFAPGRRRGDSPVHRAHSGAPAEGRARAAVARGAPVPHLPGGRRAARPPRARTSARHRDRGPSLGMVALPPLGDDEQERRRRGRRARAYRARAARSPATDKTYGGTTPRYAARRKAGHSTRASLAIIGGSASR